MARRIGGWEVISWALVFSAPVMLVLVLLSGRSTGPPAPSAWAGFLYVSVFSMFLGFFAWNKGMAMGGIAKIGQIQLLQPFVALAASAALLGERVGLARDRLCRAGGRHRGPGLAHAGRAARLMSERCPAGAAVACRGWRSTTGADNGETIHGEDIDVQRARACWSWRSHADRLRRNRPRMPSVLWLNPENDSNIEFYKCGGEGLCAKVTKVTDGQKTDDKNPDPAKRSQPIVGLVIMENAKKSGANKWSGTLYNRENGKSYSGTITVKSKDAVDLSGCVAAVLCRR